MAITRVQSASATHPSGGTGVMSLVLPAAPTHGNTFFLVLTSTSESDIGSVAQSGVTNWTRVDPPTDHSGSPQIRVEMWEAQDVGLAVGSTVTVTLNDSLESYVGILVEYEDILRFGTSVDVKTTDSGSSNIANSGTTATTTQAEELWFAIISNLQGNSQQQIPTNGFTEVDQLATGLLSSDLNLGVYEKIVSSTGTANTELTLLSSQAWVGAVYAIKEDVSVEHQFTPSINLAVAEPYDIGAFLDISTAEENILPLDMSMVVKGINEFVTANLSPYIIPFVASVTALADMWIDATWPAPSLPTPGVGEVNAGLDLAIDGDPSAVAPPELTSLLDIYVIGDVSLTVVLDVFKALVFDRKAFLNIHVGASGSTAQRIRTGMDVAVLPSTVLSNVTTTPDGSQYGNCRSLWQAVPKQAKLFSQLDVLLDP